MKMRYRGSNTCVHVIWNLLKKCNNLISHTSVEASGISNYFSEHVMVMIPIITKVKVKIVPHYQASGYNIYIIPFCSACYPPATTLYVCMLPSDCNTITAQTSNRSSHLGASWGLLLGVVTGNMLCSKSLASVHFHHCGLDSAWDAIFK